MHYHLEIIMPPTEDIESAVRQVMRPFNEQADDEDFGRYRFWDWWVIGGRFAGAKLQAKLGSEKIDAFYAELTSRNVTVSSLTAGKQEIKPAEQIPMVDELWRQYFPNTTDACPLFKHANNQYDSDSRLVGDVCLWSEVPESISVSKVIFAAPEFRGTEIQAAFMVSTDFWNGCNHEKTRWDGTWKGALALQSDYVGASHYSDEYRERVSVKDDWIAVTVDYHS